MPATCDCAWLLTMPIVATMRGHRSLALLDRSHYDPFKPCAPGEFRVFESVGCLQLFAFCLHCCNILQHLSKFVAVIAVTARLKFVWQGRVYIRCHGEGVWGRANHLDPGCSSVAFWQQRAVSPLWLGFASADVGWVIWIEVVITEQVCSSNKEAINSNSRPIGATPDRKYRVHVPCHRRIQLSLNIARRHTESSHVRAQRVTKSKLHMAAARPARPARAPTNRSPNMLRENWRLQDTTTSAFIPFLLIKN